MKEIYAWVPWFQELARKIADGGEEYLIERARRVDWGSDDPALLKFGDENIDPFSFFYFLAQKNTAKKYKPVYTSVDQVFAINNPLPDFDDAEQWIFPTPPALAAALFHNKGKGDPELLWRLFRQAVSSSGDMNLVDFKSALEIPFVAVAKLTQSLFLVNPRCFLPVDGVSLELLKKLRNCSKSKIETSMKNEGWEYYRTLIEDYKSQFPGRECYEINYEMYTKKDAPQDDESVVPEKSSGENSMNSLNRILYGPPGTGKTWSTVSHAVAIIDGKEVTELEEDRDSVKQRFDELKESGQIEMVTFHQNFQYEDFIEGIKPTMGDTDSLQYEIVDGIFKEITLRARKNLEQYDSAGEELDVEMLLRDFAEHINNRIDQGETIRMFPGTKFLTYITRARTLSNGKIQFQLAFGENETRGVSSNTILRDFQRYSTGEITTYKQIRPVRKSSRGWHGSAIYLITLMEQMEAYRKETWQPDKRPMEKRQNYVLVIDEINRGNIAKIFGELITLIEPSKRLGRSDAASVTLPYSGSGDDAESFGVPDNLYIIGTMNTADRSIALLDTALRRRFDFIEMMPEPHHPLVSKDIEGVDCRQMLDVMNRRITVLLDREHQVGHSYLIGVDSMETLAGAFRNRIMPLLQEYFYDNWAKIDLVLDGNGFVSDFDVKGGLFTNTDLVDTDRKIYELIGATSSEWTNPESYRKIYDRQKAEGGADAE